nr:hypothetical protein CFP56_65793 [Quercus suber]
MCSSKTEGESEEEIKPAAKQIECWWPSFMQPNLSRSQGPLQATRWLSLSLSLYSRRFLSPKPDSLSSSAMPEPHEYGHHTRQHKSTSSPPLMAADLSLFLFYPLVDLVIRL